MKLVCARSRTAAILTVMVIHELGDTRSSWASKLARRRPKSLQSTHPRTCMLTPSFRLAHASFLILTEGVSFLVCQRFFHIFSKVQVSTWYPCRLHLSDMCRFCQHFVHITNQVCVNIWSAKLLGAQRSQLRYWRPVQAPLQHQHLELRPWAL